MRNVDFMVCWQHYCMLLTLGNGLPAQVGVPITRLPVQCYLSRGQQMGSEGLWIRTACVQRRNLHWAG